MSALQQVELERNSGGRFGRLWVGFIKCSSERCNGSSGATLSAVDSGFPPMQFGPTPVFAWNPPHDNGQGSVDNGKI
jgi:hypothetical protein